MVKAKKNINSLLISIVVSILIITFLETRLGVCVSIRKIVKMFFPFFNGRRDLIVNIFIGILGSSVVGSFAFLIDFFSEKNVFSRIWEDRFLRDYIPLLVKMGKGTLGVEEINPSKIISDLIEIDENIKYLDKTSSARDIHKVLRAIHMIFILWQYADSSIEIAKNVIKEKRASQDRYRSRMYPEKEIHAAYHDSIYVQIMVSENEKNRKEIERIEKEIIKWSDYQAEMENLIQHNLREVLVGELYNAIDSCCTFAGYRNKELLALHEQEINRRIKTGEKMDNQIIVLTREDMRKSYSFDGVEA